jgi:hypothetical protein
LATTMVEDSTAWTNQVDVEVAQHHVKLEGHEVSTRVKSPVDEAEKRFSLFTLECIRAHYKWFPFNYSGPLHLNGFSAWTSQDILFLSRKRIIVLLYPYKLHLKDPSPKFSTECSIIWIKVLT